MRRTAYWTAVMVAVAAVGAGGWYAYAGYSASAGPSGAVRGYFAALARADAPGALAYGEVPPGQHDLLTSAVLRQQQDLAPLHDVHILDVAATGDRADVRFSYRLGFPGDDQEFTATLRTTDTNSGWRLARTAVPVTIEIDQATDRLSFAGTTVPDGPTLLFPGAVPVRFDTPNLQVDPVTAAVQFAGDSSLEVTIQPSASARASLLQSLKAGLARCFSAAPRPTNCPAPSDRFVPGSLRGRIAGPVAPKITFGVATSAAGVITMSGRLGFTGRYRELAYDNVAEARRGTVSLPVHAAAPALGPLRLQFIGSP